MATHDYIISNASGAAVRADLNNALAAIASNNSSATEPTTTYAYQWWADTGSSPTVMKLRNAANSAWITLFQLDGEWSLIPFENGTAAAPSIYFKDSGTDTGLFSGGTDQVNVTTGGVERVEWGASEVVFNDGGENYDFRIESDTNANIFFVDASANAVGIGTTSPVRKLHVAVAGSDPQLRLQDTSATESIWAAIEFNGDTNRQAFIGKAGSSDLLIVNDSASGALRFSTNATERGRFTSDGKLLVGTSSGTKVLTVNQIGGDGDGIQLIHPTRTGKWLISHSGTASENLAFIQNNGTTDNTSYVMGRDVHRISTGNVERWVIDSSGSFIGAAGSAIVAPYVYNTTTATAANVNVDATGFLRRSTSSIKYKTNVETIQDQYADAILGCRPVWYQSTCEADKPDWGHWGFIAEEVAAIDPRLCFFKEEEDGTLEPEGVQYDRFVPHLLNLIKRQGEAIADLQAEVAALKAQ